VTHYHRFREQFAEAMDSRLYPIEYLDHLITTGAAQSFISENAAIVAEVKTFPSGAKAVAGLIAAGELEEIETILIPIAEEWGRMNGCTFGMIDSRSGWARRMKQHGYETWQVSLIKEL
jgi:hypothetical protein